MKTLKIKKELISRISEIDDLPFLEELKILVDSKRSTEIIQLTKEELNEIVLSRKDIEQGLYTDNKALIKEVKQWLKLR